MLRNLNLSRLQRSLRMLFSALVIAGTCTGLQAADDSSTSPEQRVQAEKRLVEILAKIERHEINEAFRAVKALTEEVPNFRAAQLLYADMLRLRTGSAPIGEQLARSQATPSKQNIGVADKNIAPAEFYQGLQSELQRRRQALLDAPPVGKIPSSFMRLSPSVRHAIAVDASKSRLYVFANRPEGVQLISDFYVTIGRNGVHKRVEGDQRTPLGVYFVGRQIPGEKLPDLYGKGALTVNYPNDWDRMLGRTGSGIWLHGVPSDQFARVPQASDGCVVLSNPDIAFLMASIDRRTPVLITEKLDWVAPSWTEHPDSFTQELERWQTAWQQGDTSSLKALYSPELTEDDAAFNQRKRRLQSMGVLSDKATKDASIYQWQEDAGEIRIVNLHVAQGSTATVRQYWRKQDGRWQIFSEDMLS